MTLEEFLRLPERKPALEYEDGVVTQKAWPGGRHSVLQTTVVSLINDGARIRKQCLALLELQVTYAGMSRTPDVAVYRWDRVPRDADGVIMDDFVEPPDVVIEIVSPEESPNHLIRRCLSFMDTGVRMTALVDPDDESVIMFRSGRPPVALRAGETLDLSDIIPDLRLEVGVLFDGLKD
jgi:Uma2 family endonuclease